MAERRISDQTSVDELYPAWQESKKAMALERNGGEDGNWTSFFVELMEVKTGLKVGMVSVEQVREKLSKFLAFRQNLSAGYGDLARFWCDLIKEYPQIASSDGVRSYWREVVEIGEEKMSNLIYERCSYFDYWQDEYGAAKVIDLSAKIWLDLDEVSNGRLGWLAGNLAKLGDRGLHDQLMAKLSESRGDIDFELVSYMFKSELVTEKVKRQHLRRLVDIVPGDRVKEAIVRGYLHLDDFDEAVAVWQTMDQGVELGHAIGAMAEYFLVREEDPGPVRRLFTDFLAKYLIDIPVEQIRQRQGMAKIAEWHWGMHWLFAAESAYEKNRNITGYLEPSVMKVLAEGHFDYYLAGALEAGLSAPHLAEAGDLIKTVEKRVSRMQAMINEDIEPLTKPALLEYLLLIAGVKGRQSR